MEQANLAAVLHLVPEHVLSVIESPGCRIGDLIDGKSTSAAASESPADEASAVAKLVG